MKIIGIIMAITTTVCSWIVWENIKETPLGYEVTIPSHNALVVILVMFILTAIALSVIVDFSGGART